MTTHSPPCTSNSPAALSVTNVLPTIFSIPTTSPTSQCTLASHDTNLTSVGEVVPDNGQGSNLKSYLEAILKTVQEIKVTQTIHGNILNALVQQRNAVSQASQLSRGIIPIKDLHDFQLLNNRLKTDDNISKPLVAHLSSLGGRKVFQAVARMVQAVMPDNNLALQFNYSGINNKNGLKETKIFNILCSAVQQNVLTSSATKKDIEIAVGKWFTGARDRGGKRAERAKKAK